MNEEELDPTVYENYLKDLGVIVKELALEASGQAKREDSDFSIGYMAGFHRVISLMQQQAKVFNIPDEVIGLDGIDPDEDLV